MSEKYIARSSAIAARLLGDEMMVMSTADSTFFTLNEVASVIWQAADGCTPLSEIVDRQGLPANSMSIRTRRCAAPNASSTNFRNTVFSSISDQPMTNSLASLESSMSLLAEMNQKALSLGLPLSVQLDVTYRCNERCVHCYLDHDDHGEMTTAEINDVLDQLADAGVFFLTLSGGEVLMRRDFFEIVEHARRLLFNVKMKTNGVMIHEKEASQNSRTRRRAGADQRLLAPARSSRRHHQTAGFVEANRSSDSFLEVAGVEGHDRQRSHGQQFLRPRRRDRAG